MALLGILLLLLLAVLLSDNWRAINLRVAIPAFLLQACIALLVFFVPLGQSALKFASEVVHAVIHFSGEGIDFVFGGLAGDSIGFVFAIKVLPVIIFFSSLMSILYYLKIMQWVVKIIGSGLSKLLGTGPVESLCAAANIFFDQSQSPLAVKPYLKSLNESEFFAVMVCGLASISGAILAGYASIGIRLDYLVTASFMAAPGGLLMANLIVPDTKKRPSDTNFLDVQVQEEPSATNIIEAATNGALNGLKLAVSIGALLIAFVALIALVNSVVSELGALLGFSNVSIDVLLGHLFSPIMYLLGIPWEEASMSGNLIGQKLILNEFIAFISLAEIQDQLSPQSVAITTFALCGFANFASVAILMGGLGSLVPERKPEISRRALKVVVAGTLSNLMSAAIVSAIFFIQAAM